MNKKLPPIKAYSVVGFPCFEIDQKTPLVQLYDGKHLYIQGVGFAQIKHGNEALHGTISCLLSWCEVRRQFACSSLIDNKAIAKANFD